MTEEIWKPIPGYEGYYWASNLGRIKSKHRVRADVLNTCNYSQIGLSMKGKVRKELVSRLVCSAFHGVCPFPDADALHKDDDKMNNTSDNLYWGTPLQNAADRDRNRIKRYQSEAVS